MKRKIIKKGDILQTYYQKHRTIKAFQFDGTLRQLRENMTKELWEDLFDQDVNGLYLIMNDNHIITTIINQVLGLAWVHQRVRFRGTYLNANDNDHHVWDWPEQKHSHTFETYITKYIETPKDLNYGDYIIIQPVVIEESGHQYNYHLHNFNECKMIDVVKIISKKDFEAHWSKAPIKRK